MDDIDDEVAAAMGFSSFGGSKRRKTNHKNETQGLEKTLPFKGSDTDSARFKDTELKPPETDQSEGARTETRNDVVENSQSTKDQHAKRKSPDDEQDTFIKDSNATQHAYERLNLPFPGSNINTAETFGLPHGSNPDFNHHETAGPPMLHDSHMPEINARKPTDLGPASHNRDSRRSEDMNDIHILRRGVKNEQGDLVFYSSSFVEDPWQRLEVPGY